MLPYLPTISLLLRPAAGRRRAIWLSLAAILLAVAVPVPQAVAEAIRLEISNFPVWKELEGVRGVPRGSSRLSTLERWDAQSKPYVRITNETSSPVVGFKLDMGNWDARISSCNWLYGPDQASWKWNENLQAAMFQLTDPLLPGKAMVVRLGTASKPGVEANYRMNQTLFSPANVNCVVHPTGGGVFSAFLDKGDQPFVFDNAGRPVGPGIETAILDLQKYPIKPIDTIAPNGVSEDIPIITPVPEPGAFFLAASAAAILAVQSMRRRRC